MDPDTGSPTDDLMPEAIEWCKSVESNATRVSEILDVMDPKVMQAIQQGIDRYKYHLT